MPAPLPGRPGQPGLRSRDAGDVVLGWLVRLVATFAVIGVLAFDGISLGVASLGVQDDAAAAARAASLAVEPGRVDRQAVYDAAWSEVVQGQPAVDIPVDGFSVGPDGTVTVTVERTVATLVLHHLPRSERWLTVSATATRAPV